jgi:hypothetical protein
MMSVSSGNVPMRSSARASKAKLKIASSSQTVVISPLFAACSHSAVCDIIEPSVPLV